MNSLINKHVSFVDLGIMDYPRAWDYQTRLFEDILLIKKNNRDKPASEQEPTPNYLLFCEHPHVYTLGKSGKEENLLMAPAALSTINATYHHINRGGDITYHGPGQLVAYPILDLENFFTDIHQYMRSLEEAVLQVLASYQLAGVRVPGMTGVWLPSPDRKICALGVKTSRWVTMHGLALNVHTDLSYFDHIIPCGIEDKAVTSLQQELGREVSMTEVKARLQKSFYSVFKMTA